MVAVFTKCGKTGFTYCSNFFGSKWSGKRKISRPRNRSEGVLGLKQSSYAVKRELFACKMGAKQSPHQFYADLRSNRDSNYENYRNLRAMATNTKNADESYGISTLQDKQDLQELESCGGCRVSLVRSG